MFSEELSLANHPNPFTEITTIKFELQQRSNVTLTVSDLSGQTVFEVTESGLPSGTHAFNFDASNLSNGVYIYTINAVNMKGQNYIASKKIILSK